MATQENIVKNIAEHWAFVGLAYILTFGLWSAVSGNDFITESQRTVGDSRKRGVAHLCFTVFPMSYMIVYIIFQAIAGDFKEMWTGIIALLFAVLHLLRTVCGLWQLHVFKQWIIRAARSLESLGYYACTCKVKGSTKCRHERTRQLDWSEREKEISIIADGVLVNDKLLDNQLMEGDVRCFLRFNAKDMPNGQKRKNLAWTESLRRGFLSMGHMLKLPLIIWTVSRSRTPWFSDSSFAIYLEPNHPEEIWLRWACALVGQVFPDWLRHMKEANMGLDEEKVFGFEFRLAQFAEQLLLSVGLHSQRGIAENAKYTEFSDNKSLDSRHVPHGALQFKDWSRYPKLCKGMFCKQEFLEYPCLKGAGLPYGIRHKGSEYMDEGKIKYGYAKFKAKLARCRENLPADLAENLIAFGIDELEWLAVFLSVEDWKAIEPEKSEASNREEEHSTEMNRNSEPSSVSSTNEMASGKHDDTDKNSESDCTSDSDDSEPEKGCEYFAITNLREQIGCRAEWSDIITEAKIMSFPLLRSCASTTLWRNRNILEASAHIDNVRALCNGHQISYMLKHAQELKTNCSWKVSSSELLVNARQGIREWSDAPERMWKAQIEVINESLMYQFSLAEPEYKFLEQNVTFLGCSMECLRSSLGSWVASNPNVDNQVWMPEIPINTEIGVNVFKFPASTDFASCLDVLRDGSEFNKRFVQMRLLWELQSHFHNILPLDGISPERHEAMILCVLSFPAITVDVKTLGSDTGRQPTKVAGEQGNCTIMLHDEALSEKLPNEWILDIRATCGPQDVFVRATFEKQGTLSWCAVVRLLNEDDGVERRFLWEAWRDAFGGQLEGMRVWQEQHGLSSMPVTPTSKRISSGMQNIEAADVGTGRNIEVWVGWMPPRSTIALFEIMKEGYILRRTSQSYIFRDDHLEELYHDTGFLLLDRNPVSYFDSERRELEHACIIAREVFRKVSAKDGEQKDKHRIMGKEILEVAQKMLDGDSEQQKRLGLQLTEAISVELEDFDAVKRVVEGLTADKASDPDVWRALNLIEYFCSSVASSKTENGYAIGRWKLYFENELLASKVKELLVWMLKKTRFHGDVAETYARICTSLRNYCKEEQRENVWKSICTSTLMSGAFENDDAGRERLVLGSTLPCDSEDQYALCQRLLFKYDLCDTEPVEIVDVATGLLRGDRAAQNPKLAVRLLSYVVRNREYAPAMRMLAKIFRYGAEGVPANPSRAVGLLSTVVENQADVHAMHDLANLLRTGADDVASNPARAAELYDEAVKKGGCVSSMVHLANMLIEGSGVAVNASRAVELLKRASDVGNNTYAMIRLACILNCGVLGVPADSEGAVDLLVKATKSGDDILSDSNLGILFDQKVSDSTEKAMQMVDVIERVIEKDYWWWPLLRLGHLVTTGEFGVPCSPRRAVLLFERGIEKTGDTSVMNALGLVLENGRHGVPANAKRSVELYTRAIEEDESPFATFNLAVLFQFGGVGVEKDAVRAKELYEQAMMDKYQRSTSANNLGVLFEHGAHNFDVNAVRAKELYQTAIDNNKHEAALYNLAVLSKNGATGVEPDCVLAKQLYDMAVDAGGPVCSKNCANDLVIASLQNCTDDRSKEALQYVVEIEDDDYIRSMNNLAVLLEKGAIGVPADPPRALRLYTRAAFEGGHVGAMKNLARMLDEGAEGVPKDAAKASWWLGRSSEFEETMQNVPE